MKEKFDGTCLLHLHGRVTWTSIIICSATRILDLETTAHSCCRREGYCRRESCRRRTSFTLVYEIHWACRSAASQSGKILAFLSLNDLLALSRLSCLGLAEICTEQRLLSIRREHRFESSEKRDLHSQTLAFVVGVE